MCKGRFIEVTTLRFSYHIPKKKTIFQNSEVESIYRPKNDKKMFGDLPDPPRALITSDQMPLHPLEKNGV